VRRNHLRKTRVWRGKGSVAPRSVRSGGFKVVGAAKIIFRARAADGREFLVAVQVELDFAFAPPPWAVDFPGQVCADVLAMPFHAVEDGEDAFRFKWIFPAELRVKIARVLR